MNNVDANQKISERMNHKRELNDLVKFLKNTFPNANNIFIVGGALRDRLMSPAREPKDIDIMLGGVNTIDLGALADAQKNFFGGATFTFHNISIDVWSLEETYHIKHFGLKPSISNFLKGAPFNLDKIAYDLLSFTLHDDGCISGCEERQIIYNPARPYLEAVQAARCILLKWKTRFSLHSSAKILLNQVADKLTEDDSELNQIKTYLSNLKKFYNADMPNRVIKEIAECSKL